MTIENVGFPVREPMLVAGQVDAITGYSFSSFLNLKSKGVAPEDIRVFLMSDYGLELYGNTVIVNPEFAAENPAAVSGFVRAIIRGWQDTVADPAAAVKHVLERNLVAREPVELERLEMCIADNVNTSYVMEHGFGSVDLARLASSIGQIGVTYEFSGDAAGSRGRVHQRVPAGGRGAHATVAPQWVRAGMEARSRTRSSSCATSA